MPLSAIHLVQHPLDTSSRTTDPACDFAREVTQIRTTIDTAESPGQSRQLAQARLDVATAPFVDEQRSHVRAACEEAAKIRTSAACPAFTSREQPGVRHALDCVLAHADSELHEEVAWLMESGDCYARMGMEDLAVVLWMGLEHGDDAVQETCRQLARDMCQLMVDDKLGSDSAFSGQWRDGKFVARYERMEKLEAAIHRAVGDEIRERAFAGIFVDDILPAHIGYAESLVGRLNDTTRTALSEARGTISAMAARALDGVINSLGDFSRHAGTGSKTLPCALHARLLWQSALLFRDLFRENGSGEPARAAEEGDRTGPAAAPERSHPVPADAPGERPGDRGAHPLNYFSPQNNFSPSIVVNGHSPDRFFASAGRDGGATASSSAEVFAFWQRDTSSANGGMPVFREAGATPGRETVAGAQPGAESDAPLAGWNHGKEPPSGGTPGHDRREDIDERAHARVSNEVAVDGAAAQWIVARTVRTGPTVQIAFSEDVSATPPRRYDDAPAAADDVSGPATKAARTWETVQPLPGPSTSARPLRVGAHDYARDRPMPAGNASIPASRDDPQAQRSVDAPSVTEPFETWMQAERRDRIASALAHNGRVEGVPGISTASDLSTTTRPNLRGPAEYERALPGSPRDQSVPADAARTSDRVNRQSDSGAHDAFDGASVGRKR
ncbi:hypothetical protein SAMN05216345_108190 [Cupriavidus sp. YR651]|uniref:hypothetical protein n=1 Tax=Cupriavidus sp. YR651 TaxID=1855315 RepID=UPI00087E2E49|nr:hypothetical protein [Cupriavidus sp. YR651]SDD38404.1 hypothetical protein SAMN05216345_108190 [Cupriavidus sp. YR651]